ncbi:3-oxoacyl-ACP reductase FabG [Blastococcus sp. KM273128]|uniref:3-oxoacyl-ACP reductase FabG n=2 Tax=Blastococcus TaxID=38501 RepID=UPI002108519A|nr:3-oxoacyl-ACP reductase FabG [Blastococcus sp. KM273128]
MTAQELVVLVGLQGSGKSTWVAAHLAGTHAVVSKDHWPNARRREARQQRLVAELLGAGRSVVVDNTHPAPEDRAALVALGHAAGVPVRAVWLDTPPGVCLARNDARTGRARIPLVGIHATRARFVPPSAGEGFDRVDVVRPAPAPSAALPGAADRVTAAATGSRNVSGAARRAPGPTAPATAGIRDEGNDMTEAGTTAPRVAIVTGAARGIGAATAQRLAADGFAVAVLDLDEGSAKGTVEAIEAAGGRALAVGADVSDTAQVEAAIERIVTELGPPTVLVNNAGVLRDNMLFKMSDSDWDIVMNVHLKGAFLMTRAAQKHMIDAKWGRIVNLSSTSALGNRGQANYSTAKAGLQGFTKTLAIELGKFGVTANAIAPGFIETEMTKATADRMGIPFDDFIKGAASQIPVARTGKPEDIAHLVSFFVSEGAGFVSGQVVYAAGGPKA